MTLRKVIILIDYIILFIVIRFIHHFPEGDVLQLNGQNLATRLINIREILRLLLKYINYNTRSDVTVHALRQR